MVVILGQADAGFARIARSASLWTGVAVFVVGTATAAFAPWRRVAVGALAVVLLYSLWQMSRSAAALAAAGGWSLVTGAG
ncbi:hypothetical protein D3C80_1440510 [compost metagenome]